MRIHVEAYGSELGRDPSIVDKAFSSLRENQNMTNYHASSHKQRQTQALSFGKSLAMSVASSAGALAGGTTGNAGGHRYGPSGSGSGLASGAKFLGCLVVMLLFYVGNLQAATCGVLSDKSGITVTSTISWNTSLLPILLDGNNSNNALWTTVDGTPIAGETYLQFDFGSAITLDAIELVATANGILNTGSVLVVEGSNDNSTWTDLSGNITTSGVETGSVTGAANSENFEFRSNATAYRYYRLQGVSGSTIWWDLNEANFSLPCDTDGDGVPDPVDLDDDNDGILDTNEGFPIQQVTNSDLTDEGSGVITTVANWTVVTGNFSASTEGLDFGNENTGQNNVMEQVVNDLDLSCDGVAASIEIVMKPLTGVPQSNSHNVDFNVYIAGTLYARISSGEDEISPAFAAITYHNGASGNLTQMEIDDRTGPRNNLPLNTWVIDLPDSVSASGALRLEADHLGTDPSNLQPGDDYLVESVEVLTATDTDGDGLPDCRDTDSDNDSCPDATEGANELQTTATWYGGSSGGSSNNLGASADGDGVPTVTGSPQGTTAAYLDANDALACAAVDFGDAPDSYETLDGSFGAFHRIVTGLMLGNLADNELDGQPSTAATDDDDDSVDDTVADLAGSTIDVNVNGQSTAAYSIRETLPTGLTSGDEFWVVWVDDITNAPTTWTYGVKIKVTDGVGGIEFIQTEAKSVEGALPNFDFETGGTAVPVAGSAGAAGLGVASIDYNGNQLVPGYLDTTKTAALVDDEDGVDAGSFKTYFEPGRTSFGASVDITGVTNDLGQDAQLVCWADFNQSGDFHDAGERSEPFLNLASFSGSGSCSSTGITDSTFTTGNVPAGCSGSATVVWTGLTSVPTTGTSYLRCRLTTQNDTSFGANFFSDSSPQPVGGAIDGEVEDNEVSFVPTAVYIGAMELQSVNVIGVVQGLDRAGREALLASLDPERALSADLASDEELQDALQEQLDADGDGNVALLRWDTVDERGTVGFFVERSDDGANWRRINSGMLPGLINAPLGGQYMLFDPAASAGNQYQYRILEQEARGGTRFYGPYTLEMD